jgi:2-polyprenyl-6-methoxyphenol hydroxylase-like FAD-dependent oxidoreductase
MYKSWRFDWFDVPRVIRSTKRVYEYPLVDRDPLPNWSFGRVTLLGDAAHPMYPWGSNGASQAILDAHAVAEALSGASPTVALRDYDSLRRRKTAEIVLSNRRGGPESVIQLVEERAPDGFQDLHEIVSPEELTQVAETYKRVAGFDLETVND